MSIIVTSSVVARSASCTASLTRAGVGRRRGQPPVGEVERPFDQGDRLADVMQRGREERLAQRLDPIGERGQADRRGTVERVADEGDPRHGVARFHAGVELGGHRPADLLAQDPELGHDRDRAETLVEPNLGMSDGGRRDRFVIERSRRFIVREVPSTAEDVDDRVEQLGDVIGHRMIRPLGMERLAAGDAQPAVEDAGPLGDHGVGDRVHVRGADDDIDPGVDISRGSVASRRGRRLVGVLAV